MQNSFNQDANNLLVSHVEFASIPKYEEAGCILQLRSVFKGLSFSSNNDLNSVINNFNNDMYRKYFELKSTINK